MSTVLMRSTCEVLEFLVAQFLEALDGIPDEDLATWKPSAAVNGGGEMNTLAALAAHTASAGQWMLFHQVYGDEMSRDRDSEFRAVATRAELEEIYERWLARFRERIDEAAEVDMRSMPPTIRESHPDWTRLHWLLHMIDHTALHVGHAQIHRQFWLAERANDPQ